MEFTKKKKKTDTKPDPYLIKVQMIEVMFLN